MLMVVLVPVQNFLNRVNFICRKVSLLITIFPIVNFNFLLTHAALSHQANGKVDVARLAIDMTRLTLKKMSLGNLFF